MSTEAFEQLRPTAWALPNGVQLHTVREGQGTPLFFIHGAMGDWRSWEAQWAAFTPHFDCISYSRRYSFPNHNPMPSPDHGALHEAQDLLLLMDAMGIDQAVLVGSSYGAFTALALAVQAPERVKSVVAVEPPMMKYAYRTPEGQAVAEAFRRDVIEPANAAFRAGEDERAAQIMTGGINGGRSPVNTGSAMERRLQNLRAMKMLALSSDEFPLLTPEQLAHLPMPVLLLAGRETQAVHKAIFENVCAVMPQARHGWIDAAGHGVTREQPAHFNRAALEFLGQHGR
jgi:pimeloyl-ACP methyl ester carboxylesterase